MPFAPAFDAEFRTRLRALLTWRRDVRRFRRDPLPQGAVCGCSNSLVWRRQ
jgi:5,6-dimethylbenzimidazole synthase